MDKILGIGNALTDVSVILKSDDILTALNLPKGGMVHINDELFERIQQMIGHHHVTITPGGSIANSCRAMGHLGVPVGFIGKIGRDQIGKNYAKSLTDVSVENMMVVSPNLSSGVCTSFISHGGERTFADHMGASIDLKAEDLKPEMFNGYQYLFLEGYLVQDHASIEKGAKLAKEAGMKVAMDMASYNIILEDHDFCTYLVEKYIDIIFANEEEAKALTGLGPYEAARELTEYCEIVVVKIGAKGSLIATKDKLSEVPAHTANCLDSTGAGDYFAAGFLYGLVNGHSLSQCAEIGSITAAEVVQVIGTELTEEKWAIIKHKIAEL
jgi:sugar/nucleoside kinase (ribokinase family)